MTIELRSSNTSSGRHWKTGCKSVGRPLRWGDGSSSISNRTKLYVVADEFSMPTSRVMFKEVDAPSPSPALWNGPQEAGKKVEEEFSTYPLSVLMMSVKNNTKAHIKEPEEVKLLKNLSHPNIVRYLVTVREEDTLNILLEFVPGGPINSVAFGEARFIPRAFYFFKATLDENSSLADIEVALIPILASELPEFLGGSCTCSDKGGCLGSNKGPWNDPYILKLIHNLEVGCMRETIKPVSEGGERSTSSFRLEQMKWQGMLSDTSNDESGSDVDDFGPSFVHKVSGYGCLTLVREEVKGTDCATYLSCDDQSHPDMVPEFYHGVQRTTEMVQKQMADFRQYSTNGRPRDLGILFSYHSGDVKHVSIIGLKAARVFVKGTRCFFIPGTQIRIHVYHRECYRKELELKLYR
ncbi:Phosphatidylinositol/phosphatidylcholine transfer protein SFH8 [Zea mays]|uniref:Phosphatidylinositol/phosphatidylcholine transfer protein SFH8 n=1 Tax=Zea mays TaxID=4577 RepID=A0A1D6LG70_MAIZE|nr:Phosphatidylinositol/phosphatidylcholine transfer protein SFH8 [Zea mays]